MLGRIPPVDVVVICSKLKMILPRTVSVIWSELGSGRSPQQLHTVREWLVALFW